MPFTWRYPMLLTPFYQVGKLDQIGQVAHP
jgi:hypothetical protein